MLSRDAQDWIDAQADEFMQPVAEYFSAAEAAEYGCCVSEFDGDEAHCTEGWYARLSAPGYLDCTEWIGPYESEEGALEAIYMTYGD